MLTMVCVVCVRFFGCWLSCLTILIFFVHATGAGSDQDAEAEQHHPDYLAKCFITITGGMIMGKEVMVNGRKLYVMV